MADYDIMQLSDDSYADDLSFPLVLRPSISDDGYRAIYTAKPNPGHPGYAVWLYDRGSEEGAYQVRVFTRDDDRPIFGITLRPQISGDGRYILFRSPGYYTDEDASGIYLYTIDTGEVRLLVRDQIPRWPTGAERAGEPGMRKYESSHPSISFDGSRISYIWTDYEYCGATRDKWLPVRRRLMVADIGESSVRGGSVVEIGHENTFGHGIKNQRISGDGNSIAFYAGGTVRDLTVSNLEMPPYEAIRHNAFSSPTCDVFCYVARTQGYGNYILYVAPDPDAPNTPLVVAHPQTGNVQSFNQRSILGNPPDITTNGRRVALHAGFRMGASNTGIYVYEPGGDTYKIVTFGSSPGSDREEAPLTTGAVPAISPEGHWLAYYLRQVRFRYGYADPEEYEEGETYCPCVSKDEVVITRIPSGESTRLIETGEAMVEPIYTSAMSLDLATDGGHLVFTSRANITGGNPDLCHEAYVASRSGG